MVLFSSWVAPPAVPCPIHLPTLVLVLVLVLALVLVSFLLLALVFLLLLLRALLLRALVIFILTVWDIKVEHTLLLLLQYQIITSTLCPKIDLMRL